MDTILQLTKENDKLIIRNRVLQKEIHTGYGELRSGKMLSTYEKSELRKATKVLEKEQKKNLKIIKKNQKHIKKMAKSF